MAANDQEMIDWKAKYEKLKDSFEKQLYSLSVENDLLAEENHRLRLENESLRDTKAYTATDEIQVRIPEDLLTPGSEEYIKTQIAVIENTHAIGNLLSVALHPKDSQLVATGGVDKKIALHNWKTQALIDQFDVEAPVLSISFNPVHSHLIGLTCMDARVVLIEMQHEKFEMKQLFTDHTRQGAMRFAWRQDGEAFATASSDKSLHYYERTLEGLFIKKKSFYFNGTVEALAFIESCQLILSVRGDCYLHYIDCSTLEKVRINMNLDGIEHVSYTIMDLAISPSAKYILAATDTNRHFVFEIGQNIILRDFYGHQADSYGQPRVAWHSTGKYVYSNTQKSGEIVVWCVASEKIVDRLEGHEAMVRDLNSNNAMLATVSYDKTLRIWG